MISIKIGGKEEGKKKKKRHPLVCQVDSSGGRGERLFALVAGWKGFSALDVEGNALVCCVEECFVWEEVEGRVPVGCEHNPVQ